MSEMFFIKRAEANQIILTDENKLSFHIKQIHIVYNNYVTIYVTFYIEKYDTSKV
jgi:hypothetical protein